MGGAAGKQAKKSTNPDAIDVDVINSTTTGGNFTPEDHVQSKSPNSELAAMQEAKRQRDALKEGHERFFHAVEGDSSPASESPENENAPKLSMFKAARRVGMLSGVSNAFNKVLEDCRQRRISSLLHLQRYVPRTVMKPLIGRRSGALSPSQRSLGGTVLFADLAGFSKRAESMVQTKAHTKGAESVSSPGELERSGADALTTYINYFFDKVITVVNKHQGDVIRIAGDAIFAVFPAKPPSTGDALSATLCALEIQTELANAGGRHGQVRCKIGLGTGEVQMYIVGGASGRWQYVMMGEALEQAMVAMELATEGQVVGHPDAIARLKSRKGIAVKMHEVVNVCAELKGHKLIESLRQSFASGDVMADGLYGSATKTPMGTGTAVPESNEMGSVLRSLVPESVLIHTSGDIVENWIGEVRLMTVMFVMLPPKELGMDCSPPDRLTVLQRVYQRLQAAVYKYEGVVKEWSVDDKGTVLVAGFGCPPMSHDNDPVRCVRAALRAQKLMAEIDLYPAIGVATGEVFCGSVGNTQRCEFALVGRAVNLAARLMQTMINVRGISMDALTHAAVCNTINCSAYDPVMVKGVATPVQSYRPLTERKESLEPPDSVLGHEPSLEQLAVIIKETVSGQPAKLVNVTSTMPRSHVFDFIRCAARVSGATCVESVYDITQNESTALRQASWTAYSGVFAAVLGDEPWGSPRDRRDAVRRFFKNACPERPELEVNVALLDEVLGLDTATEISGHVSGPSSPMPQSCLTPTGRGVTPIFPSNDPNVAMGTLGMNSVPRTALPSSLHMLERLIEVASPCASPSMNNALSRGKWEDLQMSSTETSTTTNDATVKSPQDKVLMVQQMLLAALKTLPRPAVVVIECPLDSVVCRKLGDLLELCTGGLDGVVFAVYSYLAAVVVQESSAAASGEQLVPVIAPWNDCGILLELSMPDREQFKTALVAGLHANDIDDDLSAFLYVRVGRSLVFALETVRAAVLVSLVVVLKNVYKFSTVTANISFPIPHTVRADITATLDRLTPLQRLCARACTMMSADFTVADVVAGFPDDTVPFEIAKSLEVLAQVGILESQVVDPDVVLLFDTYTSQPRKVSLSSITTTPVGNADSSQSKTGPTTVRARRMSITRSLSVSLLDVPTAPVVPEAKEQKTPKPMMIRRGSFALNSETAAARYVEANKYQFRSLLAQQTIYEGVPEAAKTVSHQQLCRHYTKQVGLFDSLDDGSDDDGDDDLSRQANFLESVSATVRTGNEEKLWMMAVHHLAASTMQESRVETLIRSKSRGAVQAYIKRTVTRMFGEQPRVSNRLGKVLSNTEFILVCASGMAWLRYWVGAMLDVRVRVNSDHQLEIAGDSPVGKTTVQSQPHTPSPGGGVVLASSTNDAHSESDYVDDTSHISVHGIAHDDGGDAGGMVLDDQVDDESVVDQPGVNTKYVDVTDDAKERGCDDNVDLGDADLTSEGDVVDDGSKTDLVYCLAETCAGVLQNTISLETIGEGSTLFIGRTPDADIVLLQRECSRKHATIVTECDDDGEWWIHITDLGSQNGTALNGTRLEANVPMELRPLDRVAFGTDIRRVFTVIAKKGNVTETVTTAIEMSQDSVAEDTESLSRPLQDELAPPPSAQSTLINRGPSTEDRLPCEEVPKSRIVWGHTATATIDMKHPQSNPRPCVASSSTPRLSSHPITTNAVVNQVSASEAVSTMEHVLEAIRQAGRVGVAPVPMASSDNVNDRCDSGNDKMPLTSDQTHYHVDLDDDDVDNMGATDKLCDDDQSIDCNRAINDAQRRFSLSGSRENLPYHNISSEQWSRRTKLAFAPPPAVSRRETALRNPKQRHKRQRKSSPYSHVIPLRTSTDDTVQTARNPLLQAAATPGRTDPATGWRSSTRILQQGRQTSSSQPSRPLSASLERGRSSLEVALTDRLSTWRDCSPSATLKAVEGREGRIPFLQESLARCRAVYHSSPWARSVALMSSSTSQQRGPSRPTSAPAARRKPSPRSSRRFIAVAHDHEEEDNDDDHHEERQEYRPPFRPGGAALRRARPSTAPQRSLVGSTRSMTKHQPTPPLNTRTYESQPSRYRPNGSPPKKIDTRPIAFGGRVPPTPESKFRPRI